jgi:alpha-glucosidase
MNSPDHEPWRYGKYYEDIIRKYLKLRYRLLPFLYTVLEESHRTGVPMFRPLLLNYQEDENTLGIDDEFMIGDDLLVAPILKPNLTARLVYLPPGVWFDYWTGARHEGSGMVHVEAPLETVPLFVRGGAILPLGPEQNYVGEKPADPLQFEIYPDARGEASTLLYEDDGLTETYRHGNFRQTSVSYRHTPAGDRIDLRVRAGEFHPTPRDLLLTVRPATPVRQVLIDGKSQGRAATVRIQDDGQNHRIELR